MTEAVLSERYQLGEKLGQGGMGSVYRAHDVVLEREVAVKVVSGIELETEGRARMLREAKNIAQLNHPNIVTVYDAGEFEESPYVVMELIDGKSLYAEPPKDLEQLVEIAKQTCVALEHAHARGIVHRDLKPENILIDAGGNAKLMDFGIARSVTSRVTRKGQIEGTVFYLAPELALGQEYDGRADLYALGVMLYELTTGELPFEHGDPVAVISQHLHAPVVPPRAKDPDIPPALDRLIVQLMAKAPEDRPASAAEVKRALEQPDLLSAQAPDTEKLSAIDRLARGRLIGREAEFGQARELWGAAVAGDGQTLLISGEPGVGKTRLLNEITTQSELMGGQILGAASYAEGGPPYGPFRHILRQVLPGASKNGFDLPEYVVADLLSLAPEFRSQFPDIAPNPVTDPKAEQYRLFESFFVFLAELANRAPLLIYLDDAHWSDSGSLRLFLHLARQVGNQRMMLLATYREVELDEDRPLHEVLLDLNRERPTSRVKLNRLTPAQTEELLAAVLQEEITAEFLEGIYRETEGNPFFIEEVLKALIESGELYFEGGQWHRPSMDEIGIPQSVRVAIQSRVNRLPTSTQEVLSQAAVLGREFEFETLMLAAEPGEDALIDALELAERAQLIEERSENGTVVFSFAHALIPSTLVEGLRILQRRRLHRRAARAIEKREPENYAALGLHLLEAGETEKGVDYLLLAGDQARSLYAHQEAIDSYLQALDYAKETDDHARAARTLMKLGLTYHNAFQFSESRQAYEEGFIYWQRSREDQTTTAVKAATHPLRLASDSPPTLDPGLGYDSTSIVFIQQLFSGLVHLTPDLSVVPDVARAWEVLENGRKYRFHLREDVVWSDGQPVAAEDFEFAGKRILDPDLESPLADYLMDIAGAQGFRYGGGSLSEVGLHAVDINTLEIVLERPAGYFLQLLTSFYPVPKHLLEMSAENWTDPDKIVTNGPFRLAAWDRGSRIGLERNPRYHGPVKGNVGQIDVAVHPGDSPDPLRWYADDALDVLWLGALAPEEVDRARHTHGGEYVNAPMLAVSFLAFDISRPPFDDLQARRALCQAIDLDSFAEIALRGTVSPATGGLVPPGIPSHVPDIALGFDATQARIHLREAGYQDGTDFPDIECLGPLTRATEVGKNYFEAQWQEHLGLQLEFELLDWRSYLERLDRELPHIWLGGWSADYPDPDDFLRLGILKTIAVWQHAPYDELIEKSRRSLDQGERMSMYHEAQRLLAEEVPVFPFLYVRGHLLIKPWIQQFPLSPMRLHYWKDVIIDPHE